MRIVHEIQGPVTISLGVEPHPKERDQSKSLGFRVDALMLVEEKGIVSGEEIYIEGNARYLLKALREMVASIEDAGRDFVGAGVLTEGWDQVE